MENLNLELIIICMLSAIFCFMAGVRLANAIALSKRQMEIIVILQCVKKLDKKCAISGKAIKDMTITELSMKLTDEMTNLKRD
jgi:hypothetical protein